MSEQLPHLIAIDDVLFKNNPGCMERLDVYQAYAPFTANRWLTCHSPEVCIIVNESANLHWKVLEDRNLHHHYMKSILPTFRRTFLRYVSGQPKADTTYVKVSEKRQEEIIKLYAKAQEISVREVREYIEQGILKFNVDSKDLNLNI